MTASLKEQYRKEDAWVAAAQCGDSEAFDRLMRQYGPLILSRVRRINVPGMEWEDLEQIGRLALWEAVRQHQAGRGSFTAFAERVVQARLRDALIMGTQRLKQRRLNDALPLDLPGVVECPDAAPGPAEIADRRLTLERWLKALTKCHCSKVEQVAVIGLARGMTYQEIAASSGITVKSVDNALTRLKRKRASLWAYIYGEDYVP